ncbi:hypothetical protein F5Y11DRAFT_71422 [Daldinia sp. FL1419]|nr:hypothetical protein F5Y11DRAFT_71422 [Daldinia sp. FL1419]
MLETLLVETSSNLELEGPPQLLVEAGVEFHDESMKVIARKAVNILDEADTKIAHVDSDTQVVGADVMNVFIKPEFSAVERVAERRVEARIIDDDGIDALTAEAAFLHFDRDEAKALVGEIAADFVHGVEPFAALVDSVLAPGLALDHVRVRLSLHNDGESARRVRDLGTGHNQRELNLERQAVHHVADDVLDHELASSELTREILPRIDRLVREGGRARSSNTKPREQEATLLDG